MSCLWLVLLSLCFLNISSCFSMKTFTSSDNQIRGGFFAIMFSSTSLMLASGLSSSIIFTLCKEIYSKSKLYMDYLVSMYIVWLEFHTMWKNVFTVRFSETKIIKDISSLLHPNSQIGIRQSEAKVYYAAIVQYQVTHLI